MRGVNCECQAWVQILPLAYCGQGCLAPVTPTLCRILLTRVFPLAFGQDYSPSFRKGKCPFLKDFPESRLHSVTCQDLIRFIFRTSFPLSNINCVALVNLEIAEDGGKLKAVVSWHVVNGIKKSLCLPTFLFLHAFHGSSLFLPPCPVFLSAASSHYCNVTFESHNCRHFRMSHPFQ